MPDNKHEDGIIIDGHVRFSEFIGEKTFESGKTVWNYRLHPNMKVGAGQIVGTWDRASHDAAQAYLAAVAAQGEEAAAPLDGRVKAKTNAAGYQNLNWQLPQMGGQGGGMNGRQIIASTAYELAFHAAMDAFFDTHPEFTEQHENGSQTRRPMRVSEYFEKARGSIKSMASTIAVDMKEVAGGI